MNTPNALAGLDLFKTLSAAETQKLEGLMPVKDYRRGHCFWKAGIQIRHDRRALLVILDGEVSISTESEGLTHVPVARVLHAGEIFGLISFFEAEVHSATCRAATPVRAASLARTAYDKLCESDVALAASIMFAMSRQLAKDVRQCNSRLVTAIKPAAPAIRPAKGA
jgi:CRP-like cAMP-binding protein